MGKHAEDLKREWENPDIFMSGLFARCSGWYTVPGSSDGVGQRRVPVEAKKFFWSDRVLEEDRKSKKSQLDTVGARQTTPSPYKIWPAREEGEVPEDSGASEE